MAPLHNGWHRSDRKRSRDTATSPHFLESVPLICAATLLSVHETRVVWAPRCSYDASREQSPTFSWRCIDGKRKVRRRQEQKGRHDHEGGLVGPVRGRQVERRQGLEGQLRLTPRESARQEGSITLGPGLMPPGLAPTTAMKRTREVRGALSLSTDILESV